MTRADIPLVALGALPINLWDDDSAEGGLGRTSVTMLTGPDCADRVDWFEQADRMTVTTAAAPDRQSLIRAIVFVQLEHFVDQEQIRQQRAKVDGRIQVVDDLGSDGRLREHEPDGGAGVPRVA